MNKRFRSFRWILALFCVLFLGFTTSSCSSTKNSTHKTPSYQKGRDARPQWNTTTSTHRTYYIKKRKPRKRYQD